MDLTLILAILAGFLALGCVFAVTIFLTGNRQNSDMQNLMKASRSNLGTPSEERKIMEQDPTGEAYEQFKKRQRRQHAKKKAEVTIDDLLYHAGLFTEQDRHNFELKTKIYPVVMCVISLIGFWFVFKDVLFVVLGVVIATLVGARIPYLGLERKIKARADDIMFYLPLVIEQIAIGVSSSLDIGPCVQKIIHMANERDSHNPVTEIFQNVEYLVRSGVALDEAMVEIGTRSGHNELKHTMIALAQVTRHGGEIIKQLHELADAVASQRETQIETKIKTLELKATGPVAMVFVGFILILLIGFGIQIKDAFN